MQNEKLTTQEIITNDDIKSDLALMQNEISFQFNMTRDILTTSLYI